MSFSPKEGFEEMRKAADGDPEAIAMAEVEAFKNAALEAGAQLASQPQEKKPETPKIETSKEPAKHWLAEWEDEQERQNDRRHESFDRDGNK